MKKLKIIILVIILLSTLITSAVHAVNTVETKEYSDKATLYFNLSSSSDKETILLPDNFEGDPLIPDAFFVSNSYIFIDDALNQRILVYKDNKFHDTVKINWYMDVKEMFYDEKSDIIRFVFLDLNEHNKSFYQLAEYQVGSKKLISETVLSKKGYELLNFCFDENGNLVTDYLGFDNDKPNDNTRNKDFIINKSNLDFFGTDEKGLYANDILDSYYEVVSIDGDSQIINYGIMADNLKDGYCFSEFIIELSNDKCTRFVETITNAGRNTTGVLSYNPSTGEYYQMIVYKDGLSIYNLAIKDIFSLSTTIQKSILDGQNSALYNTSTNSTIKTTYSTQYPEDVRDMMDTYKNYSWTYDSDNNGDITVVALADRSKVTQPTWLANISDGSAHSVVSIPYCWGGWHAQSFASRLLNGEYAGNISSASSSLVDNTTGMDCSGYVSVAYDLPSKHGTYGLENCFTYVKKYEVRPYYIVNKAGSHVRIISKVYYSSGTIYVDFYEESASAGKARMLTGQNYNTLYSNGYLPAIYDYMPTADYTGNTISTARTVTTNGITDYISYSQDTDTYKFIPTTSGVYTVYTTGNTDTYGKLLSSAGTVIYTYNDDSGYLTNFSFAYYMSAGTAYYIQVSGYNENVTGQFVLKISY